MEQNALTQSPFAVLTFIAAPALLTNATSVLAMSTINRMLRTRDRMSQLYNRSERMTPEEASAQRLIAQVNRVEGQGVLLLKALHSIYLALAAFISATLVTLLGAGLAPWGGVLWLRILAGIGLALGFVGVSSVVLGCVRLFRATQLSLQNIREEAELIRERQTPK